MSYREYLFHILDETEFLIQKVAGLDKNNFDKDEVLKRAFVRSLEIIGEATKKLPDNFRHEHGTVDWRAIAGIRDKLIHDYFGVDYDLVWDIVTTEIPELQKQIKKIIDAN